MTTPYHIKIAPAAKRQFLALTIKQQKFILKLIAALAVNPRPPGSKKVEGMTGLYSETIDNIRLVYKIEEQEVLLLLIK
ncbi:MAG: hypothetical protein A3E83_05965 [Gammaproteobacteria bacterium RIFCSPHIGHO2_12_FULL_41_20]|nr:MAG: hypothetical protein A3E83_05965 [Gammaproteobacteria bacterium RIFCSPHIGHO2_12_FULL_41_20]